MVVKEYNNFIKLIKEGLIKTHDIFVSKNILDRNLSNFGINYKSIVKDNNTMSIHIEYDYIDIEFIDILLVLLNNLGYFPSYLYLNNDNMSYEYKFDYNKLEIDLNKKIKSITFIVESTFDIPIDIPKYLYHVTRRCYVNKILKRGLVSKSLMKITYHPERIYYMFKLENCYKLIETFKYNDKKNPHDLIDYRNKNGHNIQYYDFDILKINTDGLDIKLYQDPNFSEKGCYGYDNIPPSNIETIEENLKEKIHNDINNGIYEDYDIDKKTKNYRKYGK